MGVRIAILTVIFVLFALAMFQTGIFLPSSHSPAQSLSSNNNIAAAHAWKDGVHQYTGTFILPHSCFRVKQSGEYKDNHNIICPHCGKDVEISEAIVHQLSQKVREEERQVLKAQFEKQKIEEDAKNLNTPAKSKG
jgi:hypothetical protein